MCRKGVAYQLTNDHKPKSPGIFASPVYFVAYYALTDEEERIRKAGVSVSMNSDEYRLGGTNLVDSLSCVQTCICVCIGVYSLSRGFGDIQFKDPSLAPEDRAMCVVPEVTVHTLDLGCDEFLVIASDGIWNFMDNNSVISYIRNQLVLGHPLETICSQLLHTCLQDYKSTDNMTLLVLGFLQDAADESLPSLLGSSPSVESWYGSFKQEQK
jgi:Protein phosphatase 2C